MHASGGVTSGLGLLNALTIAVGSLAMAGRTALLFAALATLAMLTEQVYADISGVFRTTAYTHAGLLGTSYFAIALLAHGLSSRLRETQRRVDAQEIDLANLQQVSEHVIQQMQTGVIVLDDAGTVRLVNGAARGLLGLPSLQAGQPAGQACPALAEQVAQWRYRPEGATPSFRVAPGGRPLKTRFTPFGRPGVGGLMVMIDDEAALAEQAQRLKLASLGQLTASIAHEIRNPLGAIGHATQLLAESAGLGGDDQQLMGIIRNNVQRVNEVVENVLQLSRRDRARPVTIELRRWLEPLVDDFRRSHRLRQEQVALSVDPADTAVLADPSQMGQVVSILLDNAAAHFAGEPAQLRIAVEGGETAAAGRYLDIRDNGPGIAADALDRIFEPFYSTRHHGTGLGLYIARELGETNQVRIDYFPSPGGGSCFRLSFPDPRVIG
jgi:two-component system sensor histidine kinase PilS (NtrC family)